MTYTAYGRCRVPGDGEHEARSLPQTSIRAAVAAYLAAFWELPDEVREDGKVVWQGTYRERPEVSSALPAPPASRCNSCLPDDLRISR
jgi:hypothetical protein